MSKKLHIFKQLDEIYNELINNDSNTEILELLKSMDLEKVVRYYINVPSNNLDDLDVFTIKKIIEILQYLYNNGDSETPVTDEDYDKLYELILEFNVGEFVGAPVPKKKKTRNHQYKNLRGTISKIHFVYNNEKGKDKRKSLEDFRNSIENKLGRKLNKMEAMVKLQPKWDGVSCVFECDSNSMIQHALLRGDVGKNEALDISELFKGINFNICNVDIPHGIKTEVMMSIENFDRLVKDHGDKKSPRSATTSILNSDEMDQQYLQYLTIMPLRYEADGVVNICDQMVNGELLDKTASLLDLDDLRNKMNDIKKKVDKLGLPTDGVVVICMNETIQKVMGRDETMGINKFERAFKFPPEQKKTILKSVEFTVGNLGNITPVAKIEPVKLRGNTIKSISLGSVERFKSLGLSIGDEVIIKYEIIPYLDVDSTCEISGDRLLEPPTHCPFCESELVEDPLLKCNNSNCKSRVIGKILNYVTKMRIANLDIGTITTLFNHGILNGIKDLYRLEEHKQAIIELDGFGKKSFKNMVNGVDNRRKVYDYELFGSIGIPSIGERMFKKIFSAIPSEEIIDFVKCQCVETIHKKGLELLDRITKINGMGKKTANITIDGLFDNRHLIIFLLNEVHIEKNEKTYDKKVCFSKIRDKDFESYLDNNNVLVLDSLKNDCDLLIVPDLEETSSKIEKAKKKGILVVTLDEAYKYFGYEN